MRLFSLLMPCSLRLSGPDSDKIYDVDGYTTYLPEKFPKLDYIDRCFIVGEELGGDLSAEL